MQVCGSDFDILWWLFPHRKLAVARSPSFSLPPQASIRLLTPPELRRQQRSHGLLYLGSDFVSLMIGQLGKPGSGWSWVCAWSSPLKKRSFWQCARTSTSLKERWWVELFVSGLEAS